MQENKHALKKKGKRSAFISVEHHVAFNKWNDCWNHCNNQELVRFELEISQNQLKQAQTLMQ